VLDPKAAFGIAVLQTATEEEARTLANNDPTGGILRAETQPGQVAMADNTGK